MSFLRKLVKANPITRVAKGAVSLVRDPKKGFTNLRNTAVKTARTAAQVGAVALPAVIPGMQGVAAGMAAGFVANQLRRRPGQPAQPAASAPGVTALPTSTAIPPAASVAAPASPVSASVAAAPAQPVGLGLRGRTIAPVAIDRGAAQQAGQQAYRDAVGPTDLAAGDAVLPGDPAAQRAGAATAATARFREALGPTDLDAGADILPSASERLRQRQGLVDGAAAALATGPDRVAMAREALADFDAELAESRTTGIRDIGRSAAALGRVGSGMVTGSLANLERRVQDDRSRQVNALVRDLTERDATDRFARLDAFSGLEASQRNADLADRDELRSERARRDSIGEGNLLRRLSVARDGLSFGDDAGERAVRDAAGTRDELRSERSYRDSIGEGNLLRRLSVGEGAFRAGREAGDLAVGDAERTRAAQLGERAYDDELAREALTRRERAALLERDDADREFAQGLQLAGLGYGDDPTGTELAVAGRRAERAAGLVGGAGDLLSLSALERARAAGTPSIVEAADVAAGAPLPTRPSTPQFPGIRPVAVATPPIRPTASVRSVRRVRTR